MPTRFGSLNLPQLSAAPGSPANGQVYYNTTLNRSFVYENGAWWPITDGWVNQILAADQTTTSTAAADIPTLGFTPVLGAQYEVEAKILLGTSNSVHGVRLGLAGPTGLVAGYWINGQSGSSFLNSNRSVHGGPLDVLTDALSHPTANTPIFHEIKGILTSPVGPLGAGNIRPRFAIENAATTCRAYAGSIFRYRRIN